MKRAVLILGLVIVAVVAKPQPASAGLWAWLEEFSGPGKFTGYTFTGAVCRQGGQWQLSPLVSDHPKWDSMSSEERRRAYKRPLVCTSVDYDIFSVDKSQQYPNIKVEMADVAVHLRMFNALDVGAAFGHASFHVDGIKEDTGSWVGTPLRVSFQPALLFRGSAQTHRWLRAFSLYAKVPIFLNTLTGAKNFGVPASAFTVKNDVVPVYGFVFDVTSLCRARRCG
jgi:hypothetical protein